MTAPLEDAYAIARRDDGAALDRVQWATVLKALGLDPDRAETQALVLLCDRYGLDPLLGHARLITTGGGAQTYITRDGMLDIAHRSGQLDGIVVAEQRRNSTGDGWTAYVEVWRRDMGHPFRYGAQCKDSEAQARNGYGPEMALARAERRALKRAFRIPTSDEVAAVDVDVVTVERPGPPPQEEPSARSATTGPDLAIEPDAYLTGHEHERKPARGQHRTQAQLSQIRALLADAGIGDDDAAAAAMTEIVGRPVGHEGDVTLSYGEAKQIIDHYRTRARGRDAADEDRARLEDGTP